MAQLREATTSEAAAWLEAWRGRLESWYQRLDAPSDWVNQQVTNRVAGYQAATPAATFVVTADGDGDQQVAGFLTISSVSEQSGRMVAVINEIWIDPRYRGLGYATEALQYATEWVLKRGIKSVWALTDPREPAQAALFAGYPIRALHMIKHLSGPVQLPDGLLRRPMTEGEFTAWRASAVEGYAAQRADSGAQTQEEAAAESAAQFDMLLPDGLATVNQTFLCLCAGEDVVATNWICHHRFAGTSWVYDVEVSEQHRGKGYGRAAMLAGEQATLEAGDSYLALNVFGQNSVAIGLYTSMGYLTSDQARSADL